MGGLGCGDALRDCPGRDPGVGGANSWTLEPEPGSTMAVSVLVWPLVAIEVGRIGSSVAGLAGPGVVRPLAA